MRKRSCAALLVVALVFGSMVLAAGAASALNSTESSFLSLTNGERSSRGIPRLSLASDLTAVAREHSARMARDGRIYHNENLTSDVDNWRALGENVGKGPSARSIHDAFMNSPSHRVHILDRDYDQVGIGTVTKGDVIYVTEIFADRSTPKKSVVRSAPPRRVVREAAAPKPEPARKPAPAVPAVPEPQVVMMLLTLAGMDSEAVDPRTGVAISVPLAVTMRQTPR